MDIRHTIQLSILNIEPAGLMRFPAPEADECESVRRPGEAEGVLIGLWCFSMMVPSAKLT